MTGFQYIYFLLYPNVGLADIRKAHSIRKHKCNRIAQILNDKVRAKICLDSHCGVPSLTR